MRISEIDAIPTSDTDPQPLTAFTDTSITTASGTSSAIIAPPGAGKLWEIRHIEMHAATTVASTTAQLFIQSHNAAAVHLLRYSLVGGVFGDSDAFFFLNDGLDLHNTTAVTAGGLVVARLVTQPDNF